MSDPIQRLAAELADVRRRLRNLEAAPRANHMSIRAGFTRWTTDNDAEHPAIAIGGAPDTADVALVQSDAAAAIMFAFGVIGGVRLIRTVNPDGTTDILNLTDGKVTTPLIACAWQRDGYHAIDANGNPIVSASAYETTHRTLIPCTSGKMLLRYDILLGGGVTSCATRVLVQEYGSAVAAQTLYEQTGITAAANINTEATVPTSILSPVASPIGRLVTLYIQARVTGGAGNIIVVPIVPAVNRV